MQPMPIARRRIYFFIFLAIFVVVIPFVILYTSGYRVAGNLFDGTLSLVKTGGIYVHTPENNVEIYINDRRREVNSIFQRGLLVQNLKPDTYQVIVAKEGFWPWAKEMTVREQRVTEAHAFLVPKDPSGEIIPQFIRAEGAPATSTPTRPNPEYEEILALFRATSTPPAQAGEDPAYDLLSPNETIGITREGNTVRATWLGNPNLLPPSFCIGEVCTETVTAFQSVLPIRSVGFYDDRDDVLMIAVQNGIYALEISATENQNFQPVYKGIDPIFVFADDELYVKDGESIFVLNI